MINSKELLQYTKELSLLFAEDHTELRENTTEILKNFFKTVDSVENGEEALKLYKEKFQQNETYDLVLTDIQMPKMDGVELTQKVYEINSSQTVVVLSAHDESDYLLPLINLGIEQFIKKPIDYQELLRVLLNIAKKASLPSSNETQNEIFFSADFIFNKETKILLQNAESVYLTKYEILFLEQLTSQLGKIYSNEDIVSHFSELSENIDPQNIRKLVSKLRKKLPQESLESIYGVGYRIIPFYN